MRLFVSGLLAFLIGCATAGEEVNKTPDAGRRAADAGTVTGPADAFIELTPDAGTITPEVDAAELPGDIDAAPVVNIDAAGRPDARPRPDANLPPPDSGVVGQPDSGVVGGCMIVQLLGNGDFDSSTGTGANKDITPWTQRPEEVVFASSELSGVPGPQSGDYDTWLGGGDLRDDLIYQRISVPAGTTSLKLYGYINIETEDPLDDADVLGLNLYADDTNGTFMESFHFYANQDATSGWTSFSYGAGQTYAGQTIIFGVRGITDDSANTNFFVDTLRLEANVCQ